ncbi:MAG: glycoside hydrolase family 28 protein [Saprospiraceae bacterium]
MIYPFLRCNLWLVLIFGASLLEAQVYDIRQFGALNKAGHLNTAAIQAAIDSAARDGGGEVWIPAGSYLTGTLQLRSHVALRLLPGAVLLGSADMDDYDPERPHLIYAVDCENVSLIGSGLMDGQGHAFFDTTQQIWTAKNRPTPWLLFKRCRRVRVCDLELRNPPSHILVLNGCDDVAIDGVTMRADPRSPNTDGIDIVDTKVVAISNCHLSAGDDLICLKSNRRMVQHVVATNCILRSDDAAIKFGTGSRKGVRNCVFSNISIYDTRYGIALFMTDGGIYEHCIFDNIIIRNGSRWANDYPIFIDIHRRFEQSPMGRIKDLSFTNINIQSPGNILVAGQPDHPIEDLLFDNVSFTLTGCNDLSRYAQKPRGNKSLKPIPGLRDYSRHETHAMFAHVDGLRLHRWKIRKARKAAPCPRPALWLHDVLRLDQDAQMDLGADINPQIQITNDN